MPYIRLLISLCILGLLTGCHQQDESRTPQSGTPISFRDAIGRTVSLQKPAVRVVSLAPNLTEMMYAIGAGNQLVGRTKYCDYPPEAATVPIIGDMLSPDYEAILAQKPDAILMSFAGNTQSGYDKFQSLGLQPIALNAETVTGTINTIDTVGLITGHTAEASRLTTRLRGQMDSIRKLASAVPQVTVFVIIDKTSLMTVSRGFLAEQLDLAGGKNIASGMLEAYPKYNREELLRQNPDVILIPATSETAIDEILKLYPEWKDLKALRNNRIRIVDPNVVLRPGPRIGESLRIIYAALH